MFKVILPLVASLSLACGTMPISQQTNQMVANMELAGALNPLGPFTVDGDSHKGLIEPLGKFVMKQGFSLEISPDAPFDCGCFGLTNYELKYMWIKSTTSANSQFSTMLHEAAHVLFRPQSTNKAVHEVVAEMASYQAAQKLGLNTLQPSFNYLSQIGIGFRREVVNKYAVEIDAIADRLVQAVQRGE
jgi:hypothetical protein